MHFLYNIWCKVKEIKPYRAMVFVIVLCIAVLSVIVCLNTNIKTINKITFMGVIISLLGIVFTNYLSTKNKETDIIIQRAEFTNEFVKEFRKLMPSLDWCVNLVATIEHNLETTSSESDEDTTKNNENFKKLYKELSEIEYYTFSIVEYEELLINHNLDIDTVDKIFSDFFDGDNSKTVIGFSLTPHKNMGHIRECYFDSCYCKHDEEVAILHRFMESTNDPVEKKDILEQIEIRDRLFVTAIKQCEEDVYNDLECVALNTQFGVLDYNKLTPLIYAPLDYFVTSCYLRLMNSVAKADEDGNALFSNIRDLYKRIVEIKKNEKQKRNKIDEKEEKKQKSDEVRKKAEEKKREAQRNNSNDYGDRIKNT